MSCWRRICLHLVLVLALLSYVAALEAEPRRDGVVYARAGVGRAKKPNYVAQPASGFDCRPFGECEPCPEDDLDQPFCQPFGNRRLLHCIKPNDAGKHEVPAWEACGKVVKKEQRDFYEFVTANLLILMVCLAIYAVRTSALATQQYRQLAARIGIPSGGWRG